MRSYASTNEEAARLLLAVEAKDLINTDLGAEEGSEVVRLRAELGRLITGLADELWGRTDPRAVALVRICVVDLPGKLLLGANRLDSGLAQHALREAVRGITATEPPGRDS